MKIVSLLFTSLLLGLGSLNAMDTQATLTSDSHIRVIEITEDNFPNLMRFSQPVIIDVYSNHCVYCKRLDPILKELAKEMGPNYQFAKLSLDREPNLVNQFNVHGFPTIIFIQDGKEIGRHVGYMNKETFRSEVKKYFPES